MSAEYSGAAALCRPSYLAALLERHGFSFSRGLGQNFLIDAAVPRRIAEEACPPGHAVLEIGPGIGCLTACLSENAPRVLSVELDRRLIPVLSETLADCSNVEIVQADAMRIDLAALVREKCGGLPVAAAANLPYNITTDCVLRLLETGLFGRLTFLVQKEAAERLLSGPGEASYCAAAALCSYYADGEALFDVPPGSFMPAPKVTSRVIRFVPKPGTHPRRIASLIRAAFSQRRKTLVNALGGSLASLFPGCTRTDAAAALEGLGFAASARAEELSAADFIAFAAKLDEKEK